jgi:DNA-binding CsgD family transcriptional regulator
LINDGGGCRLKLGNGITDYVRLEELRILVDALSTRLGLVLALLNVDDGTVIYSTGMDSEGIFKQKCWPSLVADVTLLPAGQVATIEYQGHHLLCSRQSLAGMDLALLTGSLLTDASANFRICPWPDGAIGDAWPSSAELAVAASEFQSSAQVVWQYLEGCVTQLYEQVFYLLEQRMALPECNLTSDVCYQQVVDLAATVPGVVVAGVRAIAPGNIGILKATAGHGPGGMPQELPLAGVWGRCLQDGKVRILDNLAEDPGLPVHLLDRLSGLSAIYLPLGVNGEILAVMVVGFRQRRLVHNLQTRKLLGMVRHYASALVALARAREDRLFGIRQMAARAQIFEQLVSGDQPMRVLSEVERLAAMLYGLSFVKIRLPEFDLPQTLPDDVIETPLRHNDAVVAYLGLKRSELHTKGTELLKTLTTEFTRIVTLWSKLNLFPERPPARLQQLTKRERQVASLVAAGESNKLIASALGITEKTVKTHVSNILRKLQLPDRTAIALSIATGSDSSVQHTQT